MKRRSTTLALLGLLPLCPWLTAQDSPERYGEAMTAHAEAATVVEPTKLDVPMPPKGAFDAAPPKHGMPAVPLGPRSYDPDPGAESFVDGTVQKPNAATVQVYRNSTVKPSGASTSNVGEPSTVKMIGGTTILQTGNWYAARSTNNGSSWSYVNPYTRLPSIDGGFCCDQVCTDHERQGFSAWLLQYSYSSSTQKGSIRIAIGVGDSRTGNPNHYYTFNPQNVGFPSQTWFDFPHISASSVYLFVALNVFNASSSYVGSVVMRLPASNLKAGSSFSYNYIRSDSAAPANRRFFAPRFANGYYGPATMYFAAHVNNTTLRTFTWADNSSGFSYRDKTIGTWYTGRTASPGPDNRDWLGRTDNRIQGGWQTANEIGFSWTSNKGGSFGRMFTRMVTFDTSWNVTRERSIWNNSYAWAYQSVSVSSVGHLAGSIMVGGSTVYPGTVGWIIDDYDCNGFDNAWVVGGNSGPDSGRGGDYLWSQYINGNKWIVTGMAQVGGSGNGNSQPHNAEIGRTSVAFPTVYTLTLNSSPVQGAGFSMNQGDYECRQNGTTQTTRRFRSGTAVSVTANSTLGSRTFQRWYIGSTAQPIGQRTISVTMSSSQTIRAQYGKYFTPSFTSTGTGCPTSGGTPTMSASGTPELGAKVTYGLRGAPRISPALMTLGFSNTVWGAFRLPLLLPGTTCYIRCEPLVTWGVATDANGTANFTLPLETNPTFLGLKFYTQYWPIEVSPRIAIKTSNMITTTVGGWDLR
ncbi:MAG: hypothetical protein KDC95_06685 [Planctomycetes bacterium]|nr:hypothetical protein [Planctomycetota bacterium]